MYGKLATTTGAGAAGSLPITGYSILGSIVLTVTLMVAAATLLALAPKFRRNRTR
jgi:hypothetical protein